MNAVAGPIADCGCGEPFCDAEAGEQATLSISGALIDPATEGIVSVSFSPCFEGSLSAEVTILPFLGTAVPMLSEWGLGGVTLLLASTGALTALRLSRPPVGRR